MNHFSKSSFRMSENKEGQKRKIRVWTDGW